MRRCLRCGADMIEGFGINVKHEAYGITITRNEKYRPFGNLAAPKVAICPKCGEISLYLEDLEQMKTAVYYRDFKKNAKGNNENKLLNLRDYPEYADRAAHWFSSKWRIPLEAYQESMSECLANKDREVPGVPPVVHDIKRKRRNNRRRGRNSQRLSRPSRPYAESLCPLRGRSAQKAGAGRNAS